MLKTFAILGKSFACLGGVGEKMRTVTSSLVLCSVSDKYEMRAVNSGAT